MADQHDMARAFFIITRSYPNQKLPADAMSVFAWQLQDIDGDLLLAATRLAVSRTKFLPGVHEIREAAVDLIVESRPGSRALAERLWISEPCWSELLTAGERKRIDAGRVTQIEGAK